MTIRYLKQILHLPEIPQVIELYEFRILVHLRTYQDGTSIAEQIYLYAVLHISIELGGGYSHKHQCCYCKLTLVE